MTPQALTVNDRVIYFNDNDRNIHAIPIDRLGVDRVQSIAVATPDGSAPDSSRISENLQVFTERGVMIAEQVPKNQDTSTTLLVVSMDGKKTIAAYPVTPPDAVPADTWTLKALDLHGDWLAIAVRGGPNGETRLGLLNILDGRSQWLSNSATGGYVTAIGWSGTQLYVN